MRYLLAFGLALLWGLTPAAAQMGNTQAVSCISSLAAPTWLDNRVVPLSCDLAGNLRTAGGSGAKQNTDGSLAPPTAAAGKINTNTVALSANTSTQLIGTNDQRIALEIQCDGTAVVGVSRTGATLTSATTAPLVIPAGSYPLYTMPVATLTAVTAYTGTAQTCRTTEYLR